MPPGTVTQPEAYLIPIPLSGPQKSLFEVVERKPAAREVRILDDDASNLGLYLRGSKLPGPLKKKVREIISLRLKVATLSVAATRLRDRIADLAGQSHEIRASLRAIEKSKSAEARAMKKKLIGLLKRSLAESLALSRQLAGKTAARATAQTRLRIALREIRIPRRKR